MVVEVDVARLFTGPARYDAHSEKYSTREPALTFNTSMISSSRQYGGLVCSTCLLFWYYVLMSTWLVYVRNRILNNVFGSSFVFIWIKNTIVRYQNKNKKYTTLYFPTKNVCLACQQTVQQARQAASKQARRHASKQASKRASPLASKQASKQPHLSPASKLTMNQASKQASKPAGKQASKQPHFSPASKLMETHGFCNGPERRFKL